MAEQPDDWRIRLDFIRCDEKASGLLAEIRPVLMAALPSMMERFYAHVMEFPETAEKFDRPGIMEHAKRAQTKHWELLFSGRFDESYRASVDRVGRTHYRIGLTPRWYIAGYGNILGDLLRSVTQSFGILQTKERKARLSAIQEAISRAVTLDMELAISTYWDAIAEERLADAETTITRINREMEEALDSVTAYSTKLVESAHIMTDVNAVVAGNATQATQAAQESLTTTHTVAAASEELNSSIAEITSQTTLASRTSRESVKRMDETREVVSQLHKAADEIGQVVSLIGEIAERTNLLALNATIEAARAGDAGKGFAVVANEVKHLATQSGKSAEEIGSQIGSIQGVARQTAESIEQISSVVAKVDEIAASISAAVEEQSAATSEINRNVGHTADQAGSVNNLMGEVSNQITNANQAARRVRENAGSVEEMLTVLGRLLQRAVRTSSPVIERRHGRRYSITAPAHLQRQGGSRDSATVLDISIGGALLYYTGSVGVDEQVSLRISRENLEMTARVVARRGDMVHLYFDEELTEEMAVSLGKRYLPEAIAAGRREVDEFVATIRSYASGQTSAPPLDKLTNHHQCELGRWYDAVTDDALTDLQEFRELLVSHANLHFLERELVKALEANKTEETHQLLQDVETVYADLKDILNRLQRARLAAYDQPAS